MREFTVAQSDINNKTITGPSSENSITAPQETPPKTSIFIFRRVFNIQVGCRGMGERGENKNITKAADRSLPLKRDLRSCV